MLSKKYSQMLIKEQEKYNINDQHLQMLYSIKKLNGEKNNKLL
jgi:hypothetical protein